MGDFITDPDEMRVIAARLGAMGGLDEPALADPSPAESIEVSALLGDASRTCIALPCGIAAGG